MKTHANTILITGGGSGIGRALAEALHREGNQVIITGRNLQRLNAVIQENHGMQAYALDVTQPADLSETLTQIVSQHPELNVLINNSGIMQLEDLLAEPVPLDTAEQTVATNLLGPIRATAALLPHLRRQTSATVIMVTSGLAFTPLATTPTYCATKAALHYYCLSLRQQLKDTSVDVLELAPPYVQTTLMNEQQATDPQAMPLKEFVEEVMSIMKQEPTPKEVLVQRVLPLRNAEANGNFQQVFESLNTMHES